jgi:hypothetical protein
MGRRSITLLVAGLAVGATMVSPVGAHITDSIDHLWGGDGHIRARVKNFGDGRWVKKGHNHNKQYVRFGTNNALPPGKTLTGTLVVRIPGDGAVGLDDASFGGKLSFTPTPEFVASGDNIPSENCPGTVTDPKAAPGYFCVYTGHSNGIESSTWNGSWDVETGGQGVGRRGVVVYATSSAPNAEISGIWVLKAPQS